MWRSSRIVLVAIAAVLVTQASPLLADDPALPEAMSVQYTMRADYADLESPITWTVIVDLVPQDISGNSVAWLIDRITMDKMGENEDVSVRWTDDSPSVSTSDGLWWIEHADATSPAFGEFSMPPLTESFATVEFGDAEDMLYSIEGFAHEVPPTLAGQATAGLDIYGWPMPLYFILQIWDKEGPAVINDPEHPMAG